VYDTREAVQFIGRYAEFSVLGHREPDGDCIASQLGMAALLGALGKTATLHSAGPFDRPEIASFAGSFSSTLSPEARPGRAVIILDCSTPDRTGPLGEAIGTLPCLVIDHHSSGEPFGTARFVDPSAPSTTMLVHQLFEDMGVAPGGETGRLLLFGLCTDTGFFRHLGTNGADTFRAVARLVEGGTSTAEAYMMVYGRRELASRRLLAEMLTRVESHWGDRLLLTWQTIEDRTRLAVTQRGEDEVYRLLQTVSGNVVVALIKEEHPGAFSVGLRSSSSLDVGVIAASFGGGGHRQASGFDIAGTLESVRKTVIDSFADPLAAPRLAASS
jgi:bifunctional oligoribonuclease and PAP phosphatase NrnA